jgi:hypothetical protein
MEAAMIVMCDWAEGKSIEMANRPCDIFKDNPTEQAYEYKSYYGIYCVVRDYLVAEREFEDLFDSMMEIKR